ncbi:hypothetical protein BaRGS_00002120 [Batillaria attramentaria]|uniref:RNA-binding region-containing protein 3 n=1 Tax=Batillaria attramentaria TaxID=370345 RepID=A0ABD0M409_9CAEN
MGGSTLLIRHLPASLTKEEKEDFLQHFGALAVRVNGVRGPLKHTAFAEFPSKDLALKVLNKLHQVEVLGCRLVVELAKDQTAGSLPTPSENTLHDRIKYPRRRRLFYLYPPPSPTILANISHALAACPKFYVQVLHLMNKMDLPAPFGPVTAQPPLAPDMATTKLTTDILETTEMEVSSAEESELESDTETQRPGGDAPAKRKRVDTKRQLKKRARLAMAMFQPQASEVKPAAPAMSLGEVFEQAVDSGSQRRIELRIPSTVTEGAGAHSQTDVIHQPSTSSGTIREPVPEPRENEESSGFGLIQPAPKSELRKGRLSQREMEKISVFRNYKEGEPSRRIYIKNLAKQVTEEDLHWVFGRYVDWDDNGQKAIFDIRLMKEGRMKGQAFVTLGTDEQAMKAVRDTNGFVLKGKPMAVQFARSAKAHEEG